MAREPRFHCHGKIARHRRDALAAKGPSRIGIPPRCDGPSAAKGRGEGISGKMFGKGTIFGHPGLLVRHKVMGRETLQERGVSSRHCGHSRGGGLHRHHGIYFPLSRLDVQRRFGTRKSKGAEKESETQKKSERFANRSTHEPEKPDLSMNTPYHVILLQPGKQFLGEHSHSGNFKEKEREPKFRGSRADQTGGSWTESPALRLPGQGCRWP